MRILIWMTTAAVLLLSLWTPTPAPTAAAAQTTVTPNVMAKIAKAGGATAKYAADLEQAKADGYVIITPMIPNMGYHFLNPKVQGFDVTKPPILVYVREGDAWQLVAIEWVFPKKPATAPLQGARYGDGVFVEFNPLLTPFNSGN